MNLSKFLDWLITEDITPSEVVLNTLLLLIGIAVLVSLVRMHRGNGPYKNFNLVHLIVSKDGYPDGAKVIEVGTWILLCWGFIVYATAKALPEWYVQIFVVAFVIRGGYGAYLRSKGPGEEPGTKTVTETATKTTEVIPATQNPNIAPAESSIAAKDVNIKAAGEVTVEREPEKAKGKKP